MDVEDSRPLDLNQVSCLVFFDRVSPPSMSLWEDCCPLLIFVREGGGNVM
jgi:hypothetical protein